MLRAARVNERAVCTLTGRDNVLCLPGNYVVTVGPDRSAVAVDSSQLTCLRPLSQSRRLNGDSLRGNYNDTAGQIRLFMNIRLEKAVTHERFTITGKEGLPDRLGLIRPFGVRLVILRRFLYISLIFKR